MTSDYQDFIGKNSKLLLARLKSQVGKTRLDKPTAEDAKTPIRDLYRNPKKPYKHETVAYEVETENGTHYRWNALTYVASEYRRYKDSGESKASYTPYSNYYDKEETINMKQKGDDSASCGYKY